MVFSIIHKKNVNENFKKAKKAEKESKNNMKYVNYTLFEICDVSYFLGMKMENFRKTDNTIGKLRKKAEGSTHNTIFSDAFWYRLGELKTA